ncbi:hypothetical protein SASPL_151260 [Salvia splendens]|uniref:phytol kinase n=1 Tax=Salvia splendens TaxID=180675 RepID=A0A8X8Z2U5_SALSN|nr:hypothetical protein SASPL_151260 [Salvia splendens]
MRMAYGAIVSRCAATLSSAHYLCRSIPPPSSTLHLLPAALSARIHGKLRCPVAAAAGGQLLHDAGTTALVFGGAYGLVSTFDNLTRRKIIDQVAPLPLDAHETGSYTLGAALFSIVADFQISTSTGARYLAALVPCVNCFRLVINGLSLSTDEGLIKSVSREGKPEELLGGPLYYVLVLILCAVVFWCDSPVGMISLSMMCAGDGIADIMGRRFGSTKLPYNPHKSWAGSISMFLFGFLVSIRIPISGSRHGFGSDIGIVDPLHSLTMSCVLLWIQYAVLLFSPRVRGTGLDDDRWKGRIGFAGGDVRGVTPDQRNCG